jgi:hypothetical protein
MKTADYYQSTADAMSGALSVRRRLDNKLSQSRYGAYRNGRASRPLEARQRPRLG